MSDHNMKNLIDTLSSRSGLYGVFANPEFGTTTLLMQIARIAVDNNNSGRAIIFFLELSKEMWYKRMLSIGLSVDRIVVVDNPCPTEQIIKDTIESTENARLIVIDFLELLDPNTSQKLRDIAEQYSIPIFVCGKLARNSGDFDPNNRPELITALALFESPFSSKKLVHLKEFDFLALLHRDHDCDRNIGIARRYNISNVSLSVRAI